MKPTDRADATPRRRGRPVGSTRSEASGPVTVWLPNRAVDRLIALANREEQSISATIRQLLILKL